MTLGQGHDTPLGHKQSLCEVRTSNVSPLKRYGPDTNFAIFSVSDLDLARMTLVQGHDTPLGHKQTLCEVRTSNVSPLKRYGPDTNFALFLPVTLTLP